MSSAKEGAEHADEGEQRDQPEEGSQEYQSETDEECGCSRSMEESSEDEMEATEMAGKPKREPKPPHERQQQQKSAGKFFGYLPYEILTSILSYSEIRSRCMLSGCCRELAEAVFDSNRRLWVELDFAKVPRKHAAGVTDHILRSLLEKSSAKDITRIISLRGCYGVTGSGLEPLRGSRVLEQIDLRLGYDHPATFGETGLDNRLCLNILSSMLPRSRSTRANPAPSSSLTLVKFRRQRSCYNYYDCFNTQLRNWLVRFDNLTKNKIRKNRIKCSYCTSALVDKIPEVDFEWAAVACLCVSCHRRTCQQSDCPTSAICSLCMGRFCDDCRLTSFCDTCGEFYCEECRCVTDCAACQNSYCEECRCLPFCHDCDQPFCDLCREVDYCETCENTFCKTCRPIDFCNMCKSYLCSVCRPRCGHDQTEEGGSLPPGGGALASSIVHQMSTHSYDDTIAYSSSTMGISQSMSMMTESVIYDESHKMDNQHQETAMTSLTSSGCNDMTET